MHRCIRKLVWVYVLFRMIARLNLWSLIGQHGDPKPSLWRCRHERSIAPPQSENEDVLVTTPRILHVYILDNTDVVYIYVSQERGY